MGSTVPSKLAPCACRSGRRAAFAFSLLFLAAPALAGPPEQAPEVDLKVDVPTFEPPKVDLGAATETDLGSVQVEATVRPKSDRPAEREAVHYEIGPVLIGRGVHARRKTGCTAQVVLRAFHLDRVPGPTGPFQTCLRLTASAGVVAGLRARIVGPGGIELATAQGEVSFARSGLTQDFVVEWSGFVARSRGTHHLEITLASSVHETVDFEVK